MSDKKWDLTRLTTGERTALRRAAGSSRLNIEAAQAFYKACGYCSPWEEQYRYAAICMQCLWRDDDIPTQPIEECLRRLIKGGNGEGTTASMEHRVQSLLETTWSDDDYLLGKLMNIIRVLKGKMTCRPDFEQLADDLKNWNHPDQFVQRRWLRTIYSTSTNNETEVKEIEENAD